MFEEFSFICVAFSPVSPQKAWFAHLAFELHVVHVSCLSSSVAALAVT